MTQFNTLDEGQPAPWFVQRNTSNPNYVFDTVGGRYIVLCFFASGADAQGQAALQLPLKARALFDDLHMSFFGVSIDPADEQAGHARQSLPGIRHFWDGDGKVARLYGVLPAAGDAAIALARRRWVVLSPALQVLKILPFAGDGSEQGALLDYLASLPPVPRYAGLEVHAPVIILPNVLDPGLCRQLIGAYDAAGGTESGFMRERDGKTVAMADARHKKRRDYDIADPATQALLAERVRKVVVPVIERVHCFTATRMERYIVGCYDSGDGGHFRPHRDNTTKGTAHRCFALSVNLNDDFDGGELGFPEYGPRTYKVPAGAAIVFAGALLHTVTPVTRGRRYAFLPFLYDEAAAALRQKNLAFLG